jgi:hypothetical protein
VAHPWQQDRTGPADPGRRHEAGRRGSRQRAAGRLDRRHHGHPGRGRRPHGDLAHGRRLPGCGTPRAHAARPRPRPATVPARLARGGLGAAGALPGDHPVRLRARPAAAAGLPAVPAPHLGGSAADHRRGRVAGARVHGAQQRPDHDGARSLRRSRTARGRVAAHDRHPAAGERHLGGPGLPPAVRGEGAAADDARRAQRDTRAGEQHLVRDDGERDPRHRPDGTDRVLQRGCRADERLPGGGGRRPGLDRAAPLARRGPAAVDRVR